jgi:phenylacetate-CoA ligase
MHITDENIIIEIVDEDGSLVPNGTAGEIVVTHLESHDFPFLRYKTGDIGILSDDTCSCGRGLSILKSVEGRSTDFIVTSRGTIMHGLALIYVVRDIEGIKEFKIVQEDYDKRITIKSDSSFLSMRPLQNIRKTSLEKVSKTDWARVWSLTSFIKTGYLLSDPGSLDM